MQNKFQILLYVCMVLAIGVAMVDSQFAQARTSASSSMEIAIYELSQDTSGIVKSIESRL